MLYFNVTVIDPGGEDPYGGNAFAFRGMAFRNGPPANALGQPAIAQSLRFVKHHSGKAPDVCCLAPELRCISLNIPAFAIWQIDTLARCFHRYCNILQIASRDIRFRRGCVALMASAERISDRLDLVRDTNQWTTFNRAAFELRQDCDLLADMVGMAD